MGRKKRVVQLDYYTGEVIEIYNSIGEAADDNWLARDTFDRMMREQGGVMVRKKLRFEIEGATV